MAVELRYALRRGEVWRWYWKGWRKVRWKVHLMFFVLMAGPDLLLSQSPFPLRILQACMLGGALVAFLIIYPQIKFKAQTRTLKVDSKGLYTSIGRRSGERLWSEMKSLDDDGAYLTLTVKSGNAFVVPSRAFGSDAEREAFKAFVLEHL